MPKSNYTFIQGDPIDVGSHGETDYLFHNGDPVPNDGKEKFVFESDIGLGIDNPTIDVNVYGPGINGDLLGSETVTTTDNLSLGSRIVWGCLTDIDDTGYSDNLRNVNTGDIIESFEDGTLSDYTVVKDQQSSFDITTNPTTHGSYSLENNAEQNRTLILSDDDKYIQVGETYSVDFRLETLGSGTYPLRLEVRPFTTANPPYNEINLIIFGKTGKLDIRLGSDSKSINFNVQKETWYRIEFTLTSVVLD